jgi:hypothetical protein
MTKLRAFGCALVRFGWPLTVALCGLAWLHRADLLGELALLGLWPLLAGVLSLVSMAHDMWADPGMDL